MADAAIMYCIVKYMFFVMFHYVCFMCVCVLHMGVVLSEVIMAVYLHLTSY